MNPVPGTGNGADPLADLRGYHLPDPVSWWPPAPGWWILAVLILIVLAGGIWWYLRRRRRLAAARAATRELDEMRNRFHAQNDAAAYLRGLSKLLRRYALAAFPRRDTAALTGEDWLRFLDRHSESGRFTQGPGRLLIEAPYRPTADTKPEELAALVEDWIRRNRRKAA